jgi:hypothetical protein
MYESRRLRPTVPIFFEAHLKSHGPKCAITSHALNIQEASYFQSSNQCYRKLSSCPSGTDTRSFEGRTVAHADGEASFWYV